MDLQACTEHLRTKMGDSSGLGAKLYKNDQVECVSLGSLMLDPGQQTEVNAAF